MKISLLLADDSEIVRKVIADLLKSDPEIEVVAECVSFAETIQLAAKLRPQFVVLDVHMGDERAVTHTQVKSGLNGSRVLAMSIWKDDETNTLAKSMGAAKLLDKTKLATELIPAIRQYGTEGSERIPRSE